MQVQFRLPDLGEGLTESEIVSWHVSVGDAVELNQVIAEVETAKAVVELPSPYTGTVSAIAHEPGTVVEVGEVIIEFDVTGDSGAAEDAGPAAAESEVGARERLRASAKRAGPLTTKADWCEQLFVLFGLGTQSGLLDLHEEFDVGLRLANL